MKRVFSTAVCLASCLLIALPFVTLAQRGATNGEWRSYGGDAAGAKYSPLDQIDAANLNQLEIVWRWKRDGFGSRPDSNWQVTPLMVGSSLYFTAVKTMDGAEKTSQFMRIFMAPGVGHCAGGAGPAPTGTMEALVAWVEEGKAPGTLLASRPAQAGGPPTRPLCQYHMVAKYKGTGSADDAASFTCSSGF